MGACGGVNIRVSRNIIRNNRAGDGGGFGVVSDVCPKDLYIEDNLFEKNVGYGEHGGGLFVGVSAGTCLVTRNEVRDNASGYGGGIFYTGGVITSSYNVVHHNIGQGGIFAIRSSKLYLDHELVFANGACGVMDFGVPVVVTHCTIADNANAGLDVRDVSTGTTIENSILWGNSSCDFRATGASKGKFRYCITQSPKPGDGNIQADPLFASTNRVATGYYVKSAAGRWDPKAKNGDGDWTKDDVSSPAIDAGDPASDFAKEPKPNGGRINLGVYGNTVQASKSGK